MKFIKYTQHIQGMIRMSSFRSTLFSISGETPGWMPPPTSSTLSSCSMGGFRSGVLIPDSWEDGVFMVTEQQRGEMVQTNLEMQG